MNEHTKFLAGPANGNVIVVGDNADFIHQTNLLLVVALEDIVWRGGGGCVDLREQTKDVLGRNGLGGGGGGCRRHVAV